ncbi:MAG: UDP-3-O-(3-hydroxymyristoyl)glucosamine N-acyltransferase [Cyclobacteriaceae bacterium]|nr:UDP-3-O-(3-hydroxymyristoyl)glucosamine N-acyltransferase [Cyclobacteriaceae bacterium]
MQFSIREIAHLLNGEIEGNDEIMIKDMGTLERATEGCISFLSNPKYEQYIYKTGASAVIVSRDFKPAEKLKTTLIRVDDPYLSFSILLAEYDRIISFQKEGVEDPCWLGENSIIGEKIYRGAFSYIGKNVTIGNNVKIYPHVYVGDSVTIGDNTLIYSGVKIYDRVVIGNNCQIHAGAVIGSDGFGYAPQKDGTYKKIPQLGNVILKDNVDIGANTTIDRATLESTVIREGVKLDNLVQVAHNVEIGENTVIAAQTGISGSTAIGKNCIIAGQVGIVGHISLADKMTIGAQSGVTKAFEKEGATILGSPAFEIATSRKSYAIFRKLPDLVERVRKLEDKILK